MTDDLCTIWRRFGRALIASDITGHEEQRRTAEDLAGCANAL